MLLQIYNNLSLSCTKIIRIKFVRYLKLYSDKKLNFESHVNHVDAYNSSMKLTGALYYIYHILYIKIMFYFLL